MVDDKQCGDPIYRGAGYCRCHVAAPSKAGPGRDCISPVSMTPFVRLVCYAASFLHFLHGQEKTRNAIHNIITDSDLPKQAIAQVFHPPMHCIEVREQFL